MSSIFITDEHTLGESARPSLSVKLDGRRHDDAASAFAFASSAAFALRSAIAAGDEHARDAAHDHAVEHGVDVGARGDQLKPSILCDERAPPRSHGSEPLELDDHQCFIIETRLDCQT